MEVIVNCLHCNAILASNSMEMVEKVNNFYNIQNKRISKIYESPRENIKKEADCSTCVYESESPMLEICVACGIAMKNYKSRT